MTIVFNVCRVSVGCSEYDSNHTWLESETLKRFVTIEKAIEYLKNNQCEYEWAKHVIELEDLE